MTYWCAKAAIERLTPDDITAISKIERVVFNGFPIKMTMHDRYTTVSGLEEQVRAFTEDSGFVYVFCRLGSHYDIVRHLVTAGEINHHCSRT